jgi:SAM-dependent methyltransferase
MERNMTTLFEEPARDPLDFNRTPAWCVELLIPELGQPRAILDAGCGDGAIGKVLRQAFSKAWIGGSDLHEQRIHAAQDRPAPHGGTYNALWCGDWTVGSGRSLPDQWHTADLIISNPPFGLMALDFLRCALARVRPGGTVAFLLPTHWDHDPDAKTEFARQRFLDSIRLPDGREGYAKLAIVGGGKNPCRPAFRGGSSTATDRYAWFMFGEPWAGQPSRRLHAIPPATTSGQLEIT